MSFNKKIYTCPLCGRTDIGEGRFEHKCPENKIIKEYQCLYNIDNFFGQTIFKEGEIYKCLNQKDNKIMLDHILYGKEHDYFNVDWILENFKPLK